jgi:hypothetical protein
MADRDINSFLVLLLPVAFGLVFGRLLISPFVTSPGDPTGSSIGSSLGGLGGLFVGIVLRLEMSRRNQLEGQEEGVAAH